MVGRNSLSDTTKSVQKTLEHYRVHKLSEVSEQALSPSKPKGEWSDHSNGLMVMFCLTKSVYKTRSKVPPLVCINSSVTWDRPMVAMTSTNSWAALDSRLPGSRLKSLTISSFRISTASLVMESSKSSQEEVCRQESSKTATISIIS